jgi:hypothetical protein
MEFCMNNHNKPPDQDRAVSKTGFFSLLLIIVFMIAVSCDQSSLPTGSNMIESDTASMNSAKGKKAPDGLIYNEHNRNYYSSVASSGISWDEANAAAQELSYGKCQAHLATITSQNEQDWIAGTFPAAVAQGYWLGGKQADGAVEPTGGWGWITGEPFLYTNWRAGEPNNSPNNEESIQFNPAAWGGIPGSWNDLQNNYPTAGGYVLEYECPTKVTGGGTVVREDIEGSPREVYGFNAQKMADATVKGQAEVHFPSDDLNFHVEVSCLSVHGDDAWIGGTIVSSDNPAAVGLEALWRITDNGQGKHASPDRVSNFPIGNNVADLCALQPDLETFEWDNGNVTIH